MRNIVILTLIVAQIATRIHGVEVLVKIPEDQADAQMSKIIEAIANVTRQENEKTREQEKRHWMELERKIDELESKALINASMPKPTTHRGLALIAYEGTPGASTYLSEHPPKYAFQNGTTYFMANGAPPYWVWFRFSKPHRLAAISILTAKGVNVVYAPQGFQVVGSSNCTNWQTMLTVEDAGFPYYDGQDYGKLYKGKPGITKYFNIPKENRLMFPCIGIKVTRVEYLYSRACLLKNIKMWEER